MPEKHEGISTEIIFSQSFRCRQDGSRSLGLFGFERGDSLGLFFFFERKFALEGNNLCQHHAETIIIQCCFISQHDIFTFATDFR